MKRIFRCHLYWDGMAELGAERFGKGNEWQRGL